MVHCFPGNQNKNRLLASTKQPTQGPGFAKGGGETSCGVSVSCKK